MESGFQTSSKHANRGPRALLLLFSAQRHFDHARTCARRRPIVCHPNLLTNSLQAIHTFQTCLLTKPCTRHLTCPRSLHIDTIYCNLNTRVTCPAFGPDRACLNHAGSTAIFAMLFGSRAYRFPLLSAPSLFSCRKARHLGPDDQAEIFCIPDKGLNGDACFKQPQSTNSVLART